MFLGRNGMAHPCGGQEMISRKDAKNAKLRILSLAFFASLRERF
jgi:hypothetical protein